jgi:hypothetical protein
MNRFLPAIAILSLTLGIAFAADKPNLAKPANKAESWRFEQHEGGKGTMKIDGDAAVFETTAVDGEAWHVQATMPGLDLKEGKEYTVSFKSKSEPARTIHVNAMIDKDDWHPIGLSEDVEMTKDWKESKFTFKAEGVATELKNRISFMLGGEKGVVSVKDLVIEEK